MREMYLVNAQAFCVLTIRQRIDQIFLIMRDFSFKYCFCVSEVQDGEYAGV